MGDPLPRAPSERESRCLGPVVLSLNSRPSEVA